MTTSNPYYDARQALDLHLQNFDGLPVAEDDGRELVHFENVEFTPKPDQLWVKINFIPEPSSDPQTNGVPYTWINGVYRMEVNGLPSRGPGAAERLAGELMRHFKRQYLPLNGSVYVRLRKPERGPGVTDLDWYRITVDAHWRFSTTEL